MAESVAAALVFSSVSSTVPAQTYHNAVTSNCNLRAQQTAAVDSRCFADRQCQTDQQWTDGYWPFQNNQCAGLRQDDAPTAFPIIARPSFHLRGLTKMLENLHRLAAVWTNCVISASYDIVRIREYESSLARLGTSASEVYRRLAFWTGSSVDCIVAAATLIHAARHHQRYHAAMKSGGAMGESAGTERESKRLGSIDPHCPDAAITFAKRGLQNLARHGLNENPRIQFWH